MRDQQALFGPVASDSTAFRVIDRIAASPGLLDALRAAHAGARERVLGAGAARPSGSTIDVDATLITAHSEKEGAAGTFKGGFGFHPLLAYARRDAARRWAALLRPGNAGANTAADQIAVLEPRARAAPAPSTSRRIEIVVRADSRRRHARAARLLPRRATSRFSVGYDLTEPVRAAILALARDGVGARRSTRTAQRATTAQVAEITDRPRPVRAGPRGSRVIVRRERPHPGAQLSFTDHDGHRFQAILTDQPDADIAELERRHRDRARVEDRIRADKDTGLAQPARSATSTLNARLARARR